MINKICTFIICGLLLINIYGCVAVVAGAAGGTGTAFWLSDKLSQEIHATYDQTIYAAKTALKSLKLPLDKETRDANITQLRSTYTDGKEIWIDIRKISEDSTKVDVRVGAINPDKEACAKILKRIQGYL